MPADSYEGQKILTLGPRGLRNVGRRREVCPMLGGASSWALGGGHGEVSKLSMSFWVKMLVTGLVHEYLCSATQSCDFGEEN